MDTMSRITGVLFVGALAAGLVPRAAGQSNPADRGAAQVEVDPIRCWWKADRTAVRVGERFGLVLTCAVIEAGPIIVVPALGQLEPGALSVTPFEVVAGTRSDDVVSPPWRYVQFEYTVRLLSDGFFGQDLTIPSVTVTYNLQSGGTQGRDQTYQLPALPMRILSLVPRSASDIRDASGQTFATIASRRFRSSLALVLAWTGFAFAGVLGVWAVARAVRQYRARKTEVVRAIPLPFMLSGCVNALEDVGREAALTGWSPALARRAVAALRVAGAVALGRPVTQDVAGRDDAARDGQISVRAGWVRPRRVLLSSPVTPATIRTHLAALARGRAAARARLHVIGDALGTLSASGYGRDGSTDPAALDRAMRSATSAVRELRTSARWPTRTADAVRSFAGF
jgi:hypothetical protein